MTEIQINAPVAQTNRLHLQWQISPASSLYQHTQCELVFPDDVDLGALPPSLLMSASILMLHAHWLLLQPCRVRLPFRLPPGECAFWQRMIDAQGQTMNAYHSASLTSPRVELVEEGPALPLPQPIVHGQRRASAFSGGKDSLFQAGVLGELGGEPLLVATTSPMPPLEDHIHPKRQRVFAEIVTKRNLRLVEVKSDFRSCYDNVYSIRAGYKPAINEISDTHLYLASLVLAAAALNAPHLYLASENELQDNVERDGVIIQHPHAMYSQVALTAIGTLLAPWGFTLGSMTSGLASGQIQQILWRRWPDLRGLQFSCWATQANIDMCNACSQCLRVALCALDAGGDPAEMGADLIKVLYAMRHWHPRPQAATDATVLPGPRVSARLHQQALGYVRRIGMRRMAGYLWRSRPGQYTMRERARAMWAFMRLFGTALRHPAPAMNQVQAGYLEHLDAETRAHMQRLLAETYTPAPTATYQDALDRTQQLAAWISTPLATRQESEHPTGIETYRHGPDTLAIVIRAGHRLADYGNNFVSPVDYAHQLGVLRHPRGHVIKAHTHPARVRTIESFQETLWVRSGHVRLDLFGKDGSAAASLDLRTGDAVLLAAGGHGFTFIEESELIEIKQGPYQADKDKMSFV